MGYLLWPRGWTVTCELPGFSLSPRDLLQAGTAALVPPQNEYKLSRLCRCLPRSPPLVTAAPAAVAFVAVAVQQQQPPLTCCHQQTRLTKLMSRVSYAGTVRDEAWRERWGEKKRGRREPMCWTCLRRQISSLWGREDSFPFRFYVCLILPNSSEYCYDTGIESAERSL